MKRYLTASVPGTGGAIREEPDDFFVEEIPLYLPCGEGEHLYLTVEKRGITTFELLHRLAQTLKIPERELGYAGLKDARATTRQTVSIPGVRPEEAASLSIDGVRVLDARLHRNKLRTGHLAGNRFVVRVRGVGQGALASATDILARLRTAGVPNYFGEQRYGSLGNSDRAGRALLRGEFEEAAREVVGDPAAITDPRWREGAERFRTGDLAGALAILPSRLRDERKMIAALQGGRSSREAVLGLPRKLLRLYLSAYQSALFDRVVTMRLDSLGRLWPGDLAWKHVNGACFPVPDPAVEQGRADTFEISPSGPLFGYKMTLAGGQAGIVEEALLEKEKIRLQDFRLPDGLAMEGERRPLRVPLEEPRAEMAGDDLIVRFALPRGSYATSVLREIMKNDPL